MKLLVTGGAGFIGSNFIRFIMDKHLDYEIMNVDVLTYAGNLENLKGYSERTNYHFSKTDITDKDGLDAIFSQFKPDAVINFAAESHVDNSIKSSDVFIQTNVIGTHRMLEMVRIHKPWKYIQISTDEVYGYLEKDDEPFSETNPLKPSSPYSASKAAADLMVLAYCTTFGINACITRCSNNYGPYQFPEKFIPVLVTNCILGKKVPVYGQGMNIRDWIHVVDHCRGIEKVLNHGESGEVYNIGGGCEKRNIDIARIVLSKFGLDDKMIEYVEDRLGHDFRYAIDYTKMEDEFGWKLKTEFDVGLEETIKWYEDCTHWWKPLLKSVG